MTEIRFYRVSGEHGYLSNLFPVMMTFGGMIFTSAEAAYQLARPRIRRRPNGWSPPRSPIYARSPPMLCFPMM